jgi:hypothetical protein
LALYVTFRLILIMRTKGIARLPGGQDAHTILHI